MNVVGCFRITLHPTTLLKCTVVTLALPSIALPPDAAMMWMYSPSITNILSLIPTIRIGCFRQTVYFL